jgi:hypothetical protein
MTELPDGYTLELVREYTDVRWKLSINGRAVHYGRKITLLTQTTTVIKEVEDSRQSMVQQAKWLEQNIAKLGL